MGDKPERQLRRRRSSGNPNLPLNLEVAFQVDEGGPSQGTPSPSCFKQIDGSKESQKTSALAEFRKKQQSFDIQIEECEEEEIVVDSDEEGASDEAAASGVGRPVTPTPIQDFAANVVYTEDCKKPAKCESDSRTEGSVQTCRYISKCLYAFMRKGPQVMDFLKVNTLQNDCFTDVSDADGDEDDEQ